MNKYRHVYNAQLYVKHLSAAYLFQSDFFSSWVVIQNVSRMTCSSIPVNACIIRWRRRAEKTSSKSFVVKGTGQVFLRLCVYTSHKSISFIVLTTATIWMMLVSLSFLVCCVALDRSKKFFIDTPHRLHFLFLSWVLCIISYSRHQTIPLRKWERNISGRVPLHLPCFLWQPSSSSQLQCYCNEREKEIMRRIKKVKYVFIMLAPLKIETYKNRNRKNVRAGKQG